MYKYSEDQALNYLVKYNYDIELALALISKYSKQFLPDINVYPFIIFIVVDIDDLVDMMRKQDASVEKAACNYDMTGSKIHHAKFSVRDTLEAREKASLTKEC